MTFKIPDILQGTPGGMSVCELGDKTGLEPAKLGRILRFLATKHIFREGSNRHHNVILTVADMRPRIVTPDVFANNRLSVELLSSNPLSSLSLHLCVPSSHSLVKNKAYGFSSTDENNKSAATLTETLSDPEWGHSYAPEHSPFNRWSKYPKSLFSWFEGVGL